MNGLRPESGSPPAQRFGRKARMYALGGILLGLTLAIMALALSLSRQGLPWTFANIAAAHSGQQLLWVMDSAPLFLGLFAGLAGMREDALEQGERQLLERDRELSSMKTTLEQRVAERTQLLEVRTERMRLALRSARQMAQVRETPHLAATGVQLLAQNLSGFRVDLYLVHDRGETAAMLASSWIDASRLQQPEFTLHRADQSLVSKVAAGGGPLGNASGTALFSVPQTEVSGHGTAPQIALPLSAQGRVLAVLHIHSDQAHAGETVDTELIQILADQLAAALDTARILEEAGAAVEQLQTISGQTSRAGWREGSARKIVAYQYTPAGITATPEGLPADDPHSLHLPLEIRGQKIGTIALQRHGADAWTDAERNLARQAATQVSLALENARLLEETRDRASQEQRMSELSAELAKSVDLDTLLQTAVRELASLPAVADASIFLTPPESSGTQSQTG